MGGCLMGLLCEKLILVDGLLCGPGSSTCAVLPIFDNLLTIFRRAGVVRADSGENRVPKTFPPSSWQCIYKLTLSASPLAFCFFAPCKNHSPGEGPDGQVCG
jgi:hypothetical protein